MSRRGGSALVTVLFTDVVSSTEIASELGDRRWQELLSRHHRFVRRELRRFGGREIDTAGDGFFATFDQPAQGVRCARAVTEAVRGLGIEVRAGLHVGQVELRGRQVGGVAVHVGARIGTQAGPGEVLVSGTLRELVPGAGIEFEDRGWRDLKGVAEPQRLYAVKAVDGEPRSAQLPAREAAHRRAGIVPPTPLRRRRVLVGLVVLLVLVGTTTAIVLSTQEERANGPGAAPLSQTLVRIDGQTLRRTARIPLAEGGGRRRAQVETPSILVGEGAVWVRTTGDVYRLDPETAEASPVGRAGATYRGGDIALGLRGVWLISTGHGETEGVDVVGLNPASSIPDVETQLPDVTGLDPQIAATNESVWVGYGDQLTEIDPQTGDLLQSVDLGQSIDLLESAGPTLWVVDSLARGLFLFDPTEGEIVETIGLQVAPDDLEIGPDGTLWILNQAGRIILPIDSSGDIGSPIPAGTDPTDIAVSDDSVWVADQEDGVIREVDPNLGEIRRTAPVGGSPIAIAVDPESGDVWVYLS
jgi:class 3 adenylate cyclase